MIFGFQDAGTNRYLPRVEESDINASSGRTRPLEGAFSSLSCWQSPSGEVSVMVVDQSGFLLRYNSQWEMKGKVLGIGAGGSITDLDGDFRPELVVSEAVWPGEPDAVQVVSDDGVLWRSSKVVGSVVAVSGGGFTKEGRGQAVVATVARSGKASRVYLLNR
jgi:hypothetical protein